LNPLGRQARLTGLVRHVTHRNNTDMEIDVEMTAYREMCRLQHAYWTGGGDEALIVPLRDAALDVGLPDSGADMMVSLTRACYHDYSKPVALTAEWVAFATGSAATG
jgi:hypothetical protein